MEDLIRRLREWHKEASLWTDSERVALIAEAADALEQLRAEHGVPREPTPEILDAMGAESIYNSQDRADHVRLRIMWQAGWDAAVAAPRRLPDSVRQELIRCLEVESSRHIGRSTDRGSREHFTVQLLLMAAAKALAHQVGISSDQAENQQQSMDSGSAPSTTETHAAECEHKSVIPKFDYAGAGGLPSHQVRAMYPRFMGECPECRQQVILYASLEHYICGDW